MFEEGFKNGSYNGDRLANLIVEMHKYMNAEYKSFRYLWLAFNDFKIWTSIVLILLLLSEVVVFFLLTDLKFELSIRQFFIRMSLSMIAIL